MAFVKLRKKEPNMHRPYKVKNYKVIGFFAVVLSGFMSIMYLIQGTGCTLILQEYVIVVGWGVLGVVFALICKMKYKERFGK